VKMAERGQLLALRCENAAVATTIRGAAAFDPVTTPRTKWAPSPDPLSDPYVGRRAPRPRKNVSAVARLVVTTGDYGWRTQNPDDCSRKGKSLADIAEALNSKGVPPAHGTNRWTGRPWCARPTLSEALTEKKRSTSTTG